VSAFLGPNLVAPDGRPPDCRPPFYRSVWDCLVLSKIQECVFWKYKSPFKNKSLWNWFIIKEKRKSDFTPKTSIRLVNTIVKPLFYQKHRIDESSVRSFCIGWFGDILEEEAGFNKKPKRLVLPKIKDFQVLDQKVDRIPRWNDQKWCQAPYLSNGMPQTHFLIKKEFILWEMGRKSINL